MLRAIPALEQRLITLMVERVRYTTRTAEQWDRLMALGKLSAGLSHELNNPAAAARRSAHRLREMLDGLREATLQFVDSDQAREAIETLLAGRNSRRSRIRSPAATAKKRWPCGWRRRAWTAHGTSPARWRTRGWMRTP